MAHPFSARRCMTAIVMLIALARNAGAVVTLDMVTVGDLGNAKDSTGFGSVSYEYQIGKYEVTIGQYTEFLNAVATTGTAHKLYNPLMGSQNSIKGIEQTVSAGSFRYSVVGDPNKPITYVSWFDAARFCNWLSSPSGDTETGSYTLSGSTSGIAPVRNPGPRFFVPNEDEWYKAAYYDKTLNSGSGGYWSYATRSNTPPGNNPFTDSNKANHKVNGLYAVTQSPVLDSNQNYLTAAGVFSASPSSYGTFDQNGNVAEWCHMPSGTKQSVRGGHWLDAQVDSQDSLLTSGTLEGRSTGFRIGFSTLIRNPRLLDPPQGDVLIVHVSAGLQNQSTATGRSTLTGSLSVIKTGTGTCIFDQENSALGSTILMAGTLELAQPSALPNMSITPLVGATLALSSTAASTTTIGGLVPNAGGLIDVRGGLMKVSKGLSKDDLLTALIAGRGNGSWTGTSGIISSTAAADLAKGAERAVGWLDHGDGSVSFGYAAPGDTNLDWEINVLDAANLLAGGKFDTASAAVWHEGDFNYDGIVDIFDAAEFTGRGLYNQGPYNTLPGAIGAAVAVPEPSGLGALSAIFGLAGWLCLRRHHA